mmetsp:Transcript_24442/g.45182  ORF Transcript_24442/g.45182 Transcript_24442/m.45182 type:complete len:270 (-) Transcript_24442:43-852(-)
MTRIVPPTIAVALLGAASLSSPERSAAAAAFAPSPPSFGAAAVGRARARGGASSLGEANTLEGRTIADGGAIRPLSNFILVRVADIQDKTESGILLSKTAKIEKTEGRVVSVGPGKVHQDSGLPFEMPVSEGDGVVYGKYDGTMVEYNGDRHALIRDDDVLVKYEGEKLTVDGVGVCNENVLVLADETEDETSGGLLLAAPGKDSAESRPSTGTVVKVGPGKMAADGTRMAMTVEEGDRVKFRDFAGYEVDIEGKEYSVVKMPEILAKF